MAADDVEQLQLEALAESLQAQQRTSKSMWRDGCVDNHERHLKRLLRRRERNYGMTEPLTIGALAALAISMTAEAAYKGFVGEIVKDSYISLKTKLFKVAGRDFDE